MPGSHPSHDTVPTRRVGGRYVLHGEIGRGGMATVHRAIDRVLDREVAIKLPHPHLTSDPFFLDRFRLEARSAAKLGHANVVTVHDWGEDDRGAYLVLQLVDGPSLRDILRETGRLDPDHAAAVLVPASAGLGAAHTAGFVHRDVKPENLLLGRDGTVRVTDFGLARAAASATATFESEDVVGSPHYLSPEAVRSEPLDPRADVYALGVVLFECLTGRPPHEGESPYATAVAHTSTVVPPPSDLVDGVPAAVDDLVRAATSHHRDDRPPDADAFRRALAAALPGHATVDVAALVAGATGPPPPPHDGSTAVDNGTMEVPLAESTTLVGTGRSATDIEGSHDIESFHDIESSDDVDDHDGTDGEDGAPLRRRHRWPLVVLVVLGLLVASAAAGYLLWDRVLAPVTPIPEVVGMTEGEAAAALTGAGFEVDVTADRPYDLVVAEGAVLAQDRTGEARQGTAVTLTVSAGPRPVEVPEVAGQTVDGAIATLVEAGLEPDVTEAHDEQVPAGVVVATEPGPGVVVDEASPIDVLVSLGPQPIEVPDLHGLTRTEAQTIVRDLGLELTVADRRHDDDAPAGTVIDQTPDGDTSLVRGDAVEVVVSDGPAPIEVPNVRNLQLAEATAELESAGFEVDVERRGGFGAFLTPGRVFDQDPAPGATRYPRDTVIVFAYDD